VSIWGAETIGTAILILLGDGVVAAVLLNHSKAQNGGWIPVAAPRIGGAMGAVAYDAFYP
jgi:glycerol uptake facilitator protein